MNKKSKSILYGIKCNRELGYKRLHKPHKKHNKGDTQDKIDICLNCTKPVEECKGDCKL